MRIPIDMNSNSLQDVSGGIALVIGAVGIIATVAYWLMYSRCLDKLARWWDENIGDGGNGGGEGGGDR